MNFEKTISYLDRRTNTNARSGCLEWSGPKTKQGYGTFNTEGVKTTAHRAVYWIFHGGSISGMEVHHKCSNKSCVNIDHLEALTKAEHAKLSDKALQMFCVNGHEFSPGNTYFKKFNGTRVCKKCASNRQKLLREMKWTK